MRKSELVLCVVTVSMLALSTSVAAQTPPSLSSTSQPPPPPPPAPTSNLNQGTFNVVLGQSAGQAASGDGNVAIGTEAGFGSTLRFTTILASVTAGTSAYFDDSIVIGHGTGFMANQTDTILLGPGAGAFSTGRDNTYLGGSAGANFIGDGNVVIGIRSTCCAITTNVSNSVQIGDRALANSDTTVIGAGAIGQGNGSVVLGRNSDDGGLSNVVSVGSAFQTRRIINVQNGVIAAGSTDAVNGGQLFGIFNGVGNLAAGYGSGASYNATTGQFTAPSYTVQGSSFNNVGGALSALDVGLTQAATRNVNAIQYDSPAKTLVTLGGVGGPNVALRNLAAGALGASSAEAVNGSQLFATNNNVTNAQSKANLADTNAGLAQGSANQAQASADRANAALITSTAALGGGASYNAALGQIAPPSYALSSGSFNNVGTALSALDNGVVTTRAVANNSIQYDNPSKSAATLGGTGSPAVLLRNLGPGALSSSSTDAVNGSQLFATNQNVSVAQSAANFARSRADTANAGLAAATAILGAGASYDSLNGSFQGPSFFVRGNTYGDVASALAALDNDVTQSDTIAVRYDDQGRTSVSLGGGQPGLVAQPVAVLNVADGNLDAASTDAVNGSQLFATNMNTLTAQQSADQANAGVASVTGSLGGGAFYDPATGAYLAPTYALTSGTYNTVGEALAALDGNVAAAGSVAGNSVQYDDPSHSAITLGGVGANPVALTNLTQGTLSASSTDAVNGSQLFATNQQVAQNTADISTLTSNQQSNTTQITNLSNAVASGTLGLVQQAGGAPGNGQITIGSATGGSNIDISGTSGSRTVSGVSAGALSASSSEAVNGAQLFATNLNVAAAQSSANQANSGVAAAAAALGGGASYDTATGAFTAPTYMVAGSSHSDVGSALAALDDEISGVSAAAANSVQYDDAAHSAVTLGGAGATPVVVKNVAAATLSAASTDAVNGSQLFATNQQVAQNTVAIAANAAQTSALSTAINNGTVGLVQQTDGNPNGQITVGAGTGGKSVSVAGTSGTRTVTGVSAGTVAAGSTEAINGAQLFALTERSNVADGRIVALQRDLDGVKYDLRQLRKDANSGIATAVALGALPQATNPGRFAIGMGTGIRDGQMAVAIGASWRSKDDMFVLNLRGGYDQSSVTAGAGLGIEF